MTSWDAVGRQEAFLDLARDCWRERAYGDFWSYMLLAEGAVDIAAEPELDLHDMVALVPIVTEAGGRFTSLRGRGRPVRRQRPRHQRPPPRRGPGRGIGALTTAASPLSWGRRSPARGPRPSMPSRRVAASPTTTTTHSPVADSLYAVRETVASSSSRIAARVVVWKSSGRPSMARADGLVGHRVGRGVAPGRGLHDVVDAGADLARRRSPLAPSSRMSTSSRRASTVASARTEPAVTNEPPRARGRKAARMP